MLVVAGVFVILSVLPERLRVFPVWIPYLLTGGLIVPMAALARSRSSRFWLRIESIATLVILIFAALGIIEELTLLLSEMVSRSAHVSGIQLLTSSIAVWVTNVLIFSLVYWRTDRGGPEARANQASAKPDWIFPLEDVPELAPKDWSPVFVDYLFLAFCTATAFSPAEAQPLTSRAKLLMMLESTISLITIVAVASRAINILGN